MKCSLFVALAFLIALLVLATTASATPAPLSLLQAGAPTVVGYQGQVVVAGTPYSGTGYFKFAVVNAAGDTSYWSNNGTSVGGGQPTVAVPLSVSTGQFSVLLGDTTLAGMPQALGASAFADTDRALRVWFSSDNVTFTQLAPDRRIAAVPYALQAEKTKHAANLVVVAKTGGDYTSIQAALDSITDATDANRYLVWVAPGVYTERVTMKPYVDIEGAGELGTKITYWGSASLSTGTVVGANQAELRFVTVENLGGDEYAVAIYSDSASPRLTHVTATAEGGTVSIGVYCNLCSSAGMANVTVTVTGIDSYSSSIGVAVSYATLMLTDVKVIAKGWGDYGGSNTGVASACSVVTMIDVMVAASSNAVSSRNVGIQHSACGGDLLTMTNATATASGGSGSTNTGLDVFPGNAPASAIIRNSTVRGTGGTSSYGVYNWEPANSNGSYTLTIGDSQVTGSSTTIRNTTRITTRVGVSQLDGGAVQIDGGTVTCAGVYDENYAFYASTCP